MTDYIVPVRCDADSEPTGLFAISSQSGETVIIFADTDKWDRFVHAVAPVLHGEGEYIGAISIEAENFEEAVEALADMMPDVVADMVFVADSAPFTEEAIAWLAGLARGG
ncbi:MAG: hypothetical protein ABW184_14145 [Sphingobium sp.]